MHGIRRMVIFVLVMLLASSAYATTVPTKVSGSTVYVTNTISIVSFNSVTKHVIMWNESPSLEVRVNMICRDSAGKSGDDSNTKNHTVLLPSVGGATPNVIEFDFATTNLGFVANSAGGTLDKVSYIVTGEQGTL